MRRPATTEATRRTSSRDSFTARWFVLAQTDGQPVPEPSIPAWDKDRALATLQNRLNEPPSRSQWPRSTAFATRAPSLNAPVTAGLYARWLLHGDAVFAHEVLGLRHMPPFILATS